MTQPGNQPRQSVQEAWDLFRHLAAGRAPYPILTNLSLNGPVLVDTGVQVGIFGPADAKYKRYDPWASVPGAPGLSIATMALNRYRTSRNRKRAEQEAAPQWRTLGHLRVVVTDRSTWWQDMEGWAEVRHDMVIEMRVDPYAEVTEMSSRSMPPIRLDGPAAAFAGILIAYFVYPGRFAAVPGLGRFAAGQP